MPKMKAEDIQVILNKAVEAALGTTENKNNDKDAIIKSLSAKVDALTNMANRGFEKEPTVEETVAKAVQEAIKPIMDKINKDETPEDEKPIEKITPKVLKELITSVIKGDGKGEKEEPKGHGKDEIGKSITDEEVEINDDLLKSLKGAGVEATEELLAQEFDQAGNEISKEKKVSLAKLDDFFGKMVTAKHSSKSDDNDDNNDNDDVDNE